MESAKGQKMLVSLSGDSSINGLIIPAGHVIALSVAPTRGSDKKILVVKEPPFYIDCLTLSKYSDSPEKGCCYFECRENSIEVNSTGCWIDGKFYQAGDVVETDWVDHPFLREPEEGELESDSGILGSLTDAIGLTQPKKRSRAKKSD